MDAQIIWPTAPRSLEWETRSRATGGPKSNCSSRGGATGGGRRDATHIPFPLTETVDLAVTSCCQWRRLVLGLTICQAALDRGILRFWGVVTPVLRLWTGVTTPHCSCGTTQISRAWGAPPTDSVLEPELDTPQSQVKGGWLLLVCHFLDALQTF